MAFSILHRQVRRHAGLDVQAMRVYLGYANESITSGGGSSVTVRERLLDRKEADVIIDATAPLLKQVGPASRIQKPTAAAAAQLDHVNLPRTECLASNHHLQHRLF